jgi:hypothetical protein
MTKKEKSRQEANSFASPTRMKATAEPNRNGKSARRRERTLRYQRQAYVTRRMGSEIHGTATAERMTSALILAESGKRRPGKWT